MPTRKSQSSKPPARSGQASPAAPAEEAPLLSRLVEVHAELAALADRGEVEEVMSRIATRGQELSGAAGAALGLIERGEVVCRASTGSLSRAVGEKLVEASLWSRSAQAPQVMRSDDTELDARVDRATWRRLGARSLVMAPLLCGERVRGVLFVLSPRPGAFGEGEERRVSLLARGGGPLLAHAEAARAAAEREREQRSLQEQVRQLEAELERARQAASTQSMAEEQKDQFLTLAERASDCIGITSLTGRPLYLNAAGRALLGFENLEVFRANSVLDTYLAEDREAARQAFSAVRERGRWEGELRLHNRRTGEAIPVWHQLFTLVARETGRPVALGSVTRDLREQKRTEGVRERLMELIGNDLRAPLSAIAVAASSLLRRGELSEVDLKAAARIAQSAERMGHMVGQVLDFTRVYLGGGLVLLRSRVDLDALAQDVVATAELEHPDRLVRYVHRGATQGLWDRERLVELLSLLLEHALRASPADRPVDVRVRGEGDEAVLEVQRMGAPLAPEVAQRLFDAFRPPGRDEAGQEPRGLGLFVARAIARAHGGDVEVRSSAAEGTLFRVRLPRGSGTQP